jgi:predicted methyltransferase
MEESLSKDGKKIICKSSLGMSFSRPKVGGHMYKIIPEGKCNTAYIQHKEATPETVKSLKISSIFSFSYREYYDFEPGTYTTLIVDEEIMMSDTPMEIRTSREFIDVAKGRVLVGGLGLGVVLLEIQRKKEVESVTVVEKNQDVLDLIVKHLPLNKKITIVKGDIFTWLPDKDAKFDTIFFDIWPTMNADNYLQMKDLHKRFRKYLDKTKEPWMSSWRYEWAKKAHYEDNAFGRQLRQSRELRERLSTVKGFDGLKL